MTAPVTQSHTSNNVMYDRSENVATDMHEQVYVYNARERKHDDVIKQQYTENHRYSEQLKQKQKWLEAKAKNSNVIFTYTQQKQLLQKLLRREISLYDYNLQFKNGNCRKMDEQELYELLLQHIQLVAQRRKGFKQNTTFKVVFVDYDDTLQKTTGLFYNCGQNLLGPTQFGNALLNSMCSLKLCDNTLYVLYSGRHDRWPQTKGMFDQLGIFDLCVAVEHTTTMDAILKRKPIFGRISKDTKYATGEYFREILASTRRFKQSVITQVLNILRNCYGANKIHAIVVDNSKHDRNMAIDTCSNERVNVITVVDPTQISKQHVQCVLGNCNDKNHKALCVTENKQKRTLFNNQCGHFNVVEYIQDANNVAIYTQSTTSFDIYQLFNIMFNINK